MSALPVAALQLPPRQRFLDRAIRAAAETGVRQFVHLATASTLAPPHDFVAALIRSITPHARITRVVHDATVPAPTSICCDTPRGASPPPMLPRAKSSVLLTDIRRPHEMLLYWGEVMKIRQQDPVVVILDQVLDTISDIDGPDAIPALIRGWVADRSVLIVAHESCPERGQWTAADLERWNARGSYLTREATTTVPYFRTGEQIAALCDGWTVMNPGIVEVSHWHPTGMELPLSVTEPLIRGGVAMLM